MSTAPHARAVMLPPLNRRLASDLLTAAGIGAPRDDLVRSAAAGVGARLRAAVGARVAARSDRRRAQSPGDSVRAYRRRSEAEAGAGLPAHGDPSVSGRARVADRACRRNDARRASRSGPEDAELERRFVASLSEQTRYFRFFYRLHELSPAMLARFTQVDYDRELALLALAPDADGPGGVAIVGIARYIANLDHESAEFAVVVADAWHGRGVATQLMKALIACAKKKGPAAPRRHRAARQPEHAAIYAAAGLHGSRRPGGPRAGHRRTAVADVIPPTRRRSSVRYTGHSIRWRFAIMKILFPTDGSEHSVAALRGLHFARSTGSRNRRKLR